MEYRAGETSSHFFRAQRFYCICEKWFFSTREHLQRGPYQSREEAEMELLLYLRHVNEGGIYAGQYLHDDVGMRL
ncbi:DUF6316 family protein [Oceanicoccus sp. KOV_DT_Chl]|uniref:DUF6316 family protein n=1 Tax=Oceanicoccus sp. KOV_DT_Chl TaxID=1904639 RepID=UPI0011AF1AEC|nr:DUF6316 family protein [Oceanicoccus sp. KOV_DT_Chl]